MATQKKQYNYIDPLTIPLRDRFVNAFRMDANDLANITESIRVNGWDVDQPVIVARIATQSSFKNPVGDNGIVISNVFVGCDIQSITFLIDGHSRRQAAINNHLSRITYIVKDFPSEDAAFAYIQGLQFNRRNLTDRDKILMLQSDDAYTAAKNKKKYVAEKLHCSERTAAKYTKILSDPERLRLVLADEETVNSVQAVKAETRKSPVTSVLQRIEKEFTAEDFAELMEKLKEMKKNMRGK